MIKFFRHIRQSLIMENKTSKYFKYAIGEIILVVIGILIALQVNDYYNNLQDRRLEFSLLKELKGSIISDSSSISRNIRNFVKIRREALFLDSIIENQLPYEKRIDSAFGAISVFVITESNYVPFEKVKSLRNGIITNDSLFNSISNYYNFSKFLADVDRYFQNGAYFRQSIYPKYFKGYRYGTIAEVSDYHKILNSDEIKVAIDYCINDAIFYRNNSRDRLEHARALINDINEELKRFNYD